MFIKSKKINVLFLALLSIAMIILAVSCTSETAGNKENEPTNVPTATVAPTAAPDHTGGYASEDPCAVNLYDISSLKKSSSIGAGSTMAQRFYATTEFSDIEIEMKSAYRNPVQIYLYSWKGSYVATMSAEPVAFKAFDKVAKDEILKFDMASSMPAGEYIFEVRAMRDGLALIKYTDSVENTVLYLNHEITEGSLALTIKYTKTPNNKLHTLSEDNGKFGIVPEQKELSADHPINKMDVNPGTWAAVDGLGRTLSQNDTVGNVKSDRYVGIFYWTWHFDFIAQTPRNVTQLLASLSPEEAADAKNNYRHKIWKGVTGYHFWDEPIYGYYQTTDKYVLRKHAELLADAGVDVIFFDNTNGSFTWQESYYAIFETFAEARKQGVDTPQISFLMNFGPLESTAEMLRAIYTDIYRPGKFQDLWFYWDGKPLMMAYSEPLVDLLPFDEEIKNFFTFRPGDPIYFTKEPSRPDNWGWLSVYPQCGYGTKDGQIEQMTVGVAQNANDNGLTAMNGVGIYGRAYAKKIQDENGVYHDYTYSYTYKNETVTVSSATENAYFYGLNFQQQWDHAIKSDPEIVFVTGWNEWVAIRFEEWGGVANGMADQFDAQYSRDCEPSNGILKDYYYYQLIENIRRFKGTEALPEFTDSYKVIDVNGSFDQWDSVDAVYNHYIKNTWERNDVGYGNKMYENNTMRNDFATAKIAYDSNYVYFYMKTVDDITPSTDPAWMRLFIDTDTTGISPNWEGFEYVINRTNPNGNTCNVEVSKDGWNWEVTGTAQFKVEGNEMMIAVERSALGLKSGWLSGKPALNFKWSDNMQEDGNIMDFYQNGDVAPGARFTFQFK